MRLQDYQKQIFADDELVSDFLNNEFDFNGSKIQDSTSVLAMLLISSEKQKISKSIETRDLVAEGIWYKDHIDIGVDFDQI